MTFSEQIEMFKNKQSFIDYISKAFETNLANEAVTKVEYELYTKDFNGEPVFQEYLVVTFKSGMKSVRSINCNSNMTNLVELGKLVNGDYYDEMSDYCAMADCGFEGVVLED